MEGFEFSLSSFAKHYGHSATITYILGVALWFSALGFAYLIYTKIGSPLFSLITVIAAAIAALKMMHKSREVYLQARWTEVFVDPDGSFGVVFSDGVVCKCIKLTGYSIDKECIILKGEFEQDSRGDTLYLPRSFKDERLVLKFLDERVETLETG